MCIGFIFARMQTKFCLFPPPHKGLAGLGQRLCSVLTPVEDLPKSIQRFRRFLLNSESEQDRKPDLEAKSKSRCRDGAAEATL
jgi:hypothetical protein